MPTVFNSNMVTRRTGADEIKHYFIILSLSLDWIWMRPEIAVNEFGQISYDGSVWHGSGSYISNGYDTSWHMTFHTGGDVSILKTYVFVRVQGTHVFLTLNGSRGLNAMLVPKILD